MASSLAATASQAKKQQATKLDPKTRIGTKFIAGLFADMRNGARTRTRDLTPCTGGWEGESPQSR